MPSRVNKFEGKIANRLIIVFVVTLLPLANWHSHWTPTSATSANAGDPDERLSVDNGRPLAEAILILETRLRTVINYEDPPYVYRGDMDDVTESVRRDLDKFAPRKAPRVFVPKGGKLEFVVVQHANGSPDASRTLAKLVSDYALTIPPPDSGSRKGRMRFMLFQRR
jgi:hypothetical protein